MKQFRCTKRKEDFDEKKLENKNKQEKKIENQEKWFKKSRMMMKEAME